VVKRRSFEDGLTADEETFLKVGRVTPPPVKERAKSPPKNQPKKEELSMNKSALKRQVIEETEPAQVVLAPAPKPVTTSNLSVRIDARITAAYLRAMTERKIQGITPATQQEIVAEAMVDWLKKHGYLS
jgi:hypothetical protein